MSKQNNISQQIRRYLNGELDARAMHQLEKEAQNDPFLMEALEGYEVTGGDQQGNLANIHARLQDRIGKKERRIIPWRMIAVAASILILLGIGGLWLINNHPVVKPQLITRINKNQPAPAVIKPAQPLDTNTIAVKSVKKHPEYASVQQLKQQDMNKTVAPIAAEVSSPDNALADASQVPASSQIQLNKDSLTAYANLADNTKRKDITGSVSTITSGQIKNKDLIEAKVVTTVTGLEGKVAGLQVNLSGSKTLTGTVTSKEDGLPLSGVTVKIKGTSIATQTNSNGQFHIDSVPQGSILELAYIGYERKDMAIDRNKIDIAMVPSGKQLGEVVVTGALGIKTHTTSLGYATATISTKEGNANAKIVADKNIIPVTGAVKDENGTALPGAIIKVKGTKLAAQSDANGKFTINNVPKNATLDVSFIGYVSAQIKAKKDDSLIIAMQPSGSSLNEVVVVGYGTAKRKPAQPVTGPGNYSDYLKDNAKSPDGKTGTVKLSFMVNADNSLSDFKIIKSVSAKTDSAAILLVKNGPAWYRNTDNKSQKIKLKIKFSNK